MKNATDNGTKPPDAMPRLLMISPAPVIRSNSGLTLDVKFVEGMRLHRAFWPGDVDCILREGAAHIPFGVEKNPADPANLDFGLRVLTADEPISKDMLAGYDLVMCDADDVKTLDVTGLAHALGIKVVFIIEYTLETRLQIARLDQNKSFARRAYSMLWNLRQEGRRKRAFRAADGVQANGYPAFDLYRGLNDNTILYLDNRMAPKLFATGAEIAARVKHLRSGAPLRLVYSGRLETMKGVQDLVPVAKNLRQLGTGFTLDIFGSGSQRDQIARSIAEADLGDVVALHEPVDFETGLVPHSRRKADIYLCCHRQSDPSCTYLENMGCGLAVAGYGNRMWASLSDKSGAGWVTPLGNPAKLAQTIAGIDRDREEIVMRGQRAVDFAKAHDFHSEFRNRMGHLADAERA